MRRGVDAPVACFPLIVNTVAGLKSADEDRINLMRSFAASRSQVFWMLRLPTDGLGISGRSRHSGESSEPGKTFDCSPGSMVSILVQQHRERFEMSESYANRLLNRVASECAIAETKDGENRSVTAWDTATTRPRLKCMTSPPGRNPRGCR
jgi:hypothetical protein